MTVGLVRNSVPSSAGLNTVHPASIVSNWVTACSAPNVADASDDPTVVTRAAQNWVVPGETCSSILVRLRLPTGATVSQNPVVALVGKDKKSDPDYQRLRDENGNVSFTLDASNVHTAGDYDYTDWIEVDLQGNYAFMALVTTALAGTSITGAVIQVKAK